MNLKKFVIILVIFFILLVAGLFIVQKKVETYLSVPRVEETQLFTVNAGSNYSRFGARFLKHSLLDNLRWWKLVGKRYPELTHIKSGTYQFEKGSNLKDILTVLNDGIEYQFKVTLVEGSTFKDWLATLKEAQLLSPLDKNETQILQLLDSSQQKLKAYYIQKPIITTQKWMPLKSLKRPI